MSDSRSIDVARVIGAVSREISSCIHEGKPARALVATRIYDTSREDLWDALTNPERLPRWFLPVSGDLRVGGRYQLEGNAGGEITECNPPELLALTWGMHGDISWVTVTLTEAGRSKTQLRLEHIARVPEDMWEQFGPGGVGVGWDEGLFGLDQHLARGGAAVDPATANAWFGTDEGKRFIQMSSDAWCAASIAFGTEASAAKAAAERITTMYARR